MNERSEKKQARQINEMQHKAKEDKTRETSTSHFIVHYSVLYTYDNNTRLYKKGRNKILK